MTDPNAGKILVTALAEVDGRIVRAERYVEPGQSVACEVSGGEVRIVDQGRAIKPLPVLVPGVTVRHDEFGNVFCTLAKPQHQGWLPDTVAAKGEPETYSIDFLTEEHEYIVGKSVMCGHEGPEVVLPMRRTPKP